MKHEAKKQWFVEQNNMQCNINNFYLWFLLPFENWTPSKSVKINMFGEFFLLGNISGMSLNSFSLCHFHQYICDCCWGTALLSTRSVLAWGIFSSGALFQLWEANCYNYWLLPGKDGHFFKVLYEQKSRTVSSWAVRASEKICREHE